MPEIGMIVAGRYRLLNVLGQGGTGIVYQALDETCNKIWAIKVIMKGSEAVFDPAVKAAKREADMLSHLHHRSIPNVEAVIEDDDYFMIIMDYIEGKTLKEIRKELELSGVSLSVEMVAGWGIQLCRLLQDLHTGSEAVVYGDVKPGNVMLRPDGGIVLIDFGTSCRMKDRDADGASCFGTPGFAAPEQYGNGLTGPWTDIYSLGALMHYMLTGYDAAQTPFYFPPVLECCLMTDRAVSDREKRKAAAFDRIIAGCTCYTIGERFGSCELLEQELSDFVKKKQKRPHLFWKGFSIMVMVSALIVCGILVGKWKEDAGYNAYMEMAEKADDEEKAALYRQAVCLDPYQEGAYTGLLDALTADDCFSDNDVQIVTELLYTRKGKKEHIACLQENESGYVVFSYRLGMAFYYFYGRVGGKIRSAGWFKNVADADMEQLQLGEYDSLKWIWQTRAEVFVRFSNRYAAGLNPLEDRKKTEIFWEEYWEDIKILMRDELMSKESVMVELWTYQEIAEGVMNHAADFMGAGIESRELESVLDTITRRMSAVILTDQVRSLKENIERMVEKAKNNIRVSLEDGVWREN